MQRYCCLGSCLLLSDGKVEGRDRAGCRPAPAYPLLPHGAGLAIVTEDISSEEAAARQRTLAALYGRVLRSKGVFWLVGRDDVGGEWSQAGAVLRLRWGGKGLGGLGGGRAGGRSRRWGRSGGQASQVRREEAPSHRQGRRGVASATAEEGEGCSFK